MYAPLKKKILRANDAPFMIKELLKTRSRLRNRYFKNLTKENETSYKTQRNVCPSERSLSLKIFF